MHSTDGVDVYEITDYRWGFNPTFDTENRDIVDEFTKLSNEQKLRYSPTYSDLPTIKYTK